MGAIISKTTEGLRGIAFPKNAKREPILMLQLQHVLHRLQEGDPELAQVFKELGVDPDAAAAGFDLPAVYDSLGAALDLVPDTASFQRYVSVLLAGADDLAKGG